jgi:DNA-binding CsgD family transcriptional regulator
MKLTLTSIELKILKYASEGKNLKDLTEDLQLSKKQLDTELKNVCHKLRTKNPLQALQQLVKTEFLVID